MLKMSNNRFELNKPKIFSKGFNSIGLFLLTIMVMITVIKYRLPVDLTVTQLFILSAVFDLLILIYIVLAVLGTKNYSFSDLGLRKIKIIDMLHGLGYLGVFYIFNIFYNVIILILGLVDYHQSNYLLPLFDSLNNNAFLIFFVVFLAPLTEELLFRGFLLNYFWNRFGFITAALSSSILFSLLHQIPTVFIPILILSLMLAFLYRRTGSIVPGIVIHVIINGISTLGYLFIREYF